jgi:hypothetical protein
MAIVRYMFIFLFVYLLLFICAYIKRTWNSTLSFVTTSNPLSSTKFICNQQFHCPSHVKHFSIHIDNNSNITFIRSSIFMTILDTIRTSQYYTNDSSSACLHIVPVDTLDRDRRSKSGQFLFFMQQRLKMFSSWSNEKTYRLVFNHYTGRQCLVSIEER